jgi:hypothetical protein
MDQHALQPLTHPALHHHFVIRQSHDAAMFSGLDAHDWTYEHNCLSNFHVLFPSLFFRLFSR